MTALREITAEQEEQIESLCALKAFKDVEPRTYRKGDDLILTFTVKGFFDCKFRHIYIVKDDGKVIKKAKILGRGK
jgi:hypothetical protein